MTSLISARARDTRTFQKRCRHFHHHLVPLTPHHLASSSYHHSHSFPSLSLSCLTSLLFVHQQNKHTYRRLSHFAPCDDSLLPSIAPPSACHTSVPATRPFIQLHPLILWANHRTLPGIKIQQLLTVVPSGSCFPTASLS